MQNDNFEFLAINTIHESTTNPRRTFDAAKLCELADSIKHNGLIQPITVRPNSSGYEIIAGARRFRAALLAELTEVPARIVAIDDAQALEWQLVENSQRVDVHPYEEAQGFQRLLDLPGYDVAALADKSGKSASHIYARLSLLQLIPEVAEAFAQERITASHANLISRLPQEHQQAAYNQCWRKDFQEKEAHLLPARNLTAWIQDNLYLSLADAPFDREDPTLNPAAGTCSACPRRSGYNTALFSDVKDDQCLDPTCYRSKIEATFDRELASVPGLVQIETVYRPTKDQRPGAVQGWKLRMLPDVPYNPDAEPVCPGAKPALIVYGRDLGKKLTVCTQPDCPVHGRPKPVQSTNGVSPHDESDDAYEIEDEDEASDQTRQRLAQDAADRAEDEKQRNARKATFQRIVDNAPPDFNAVQLRVILRALLPCFHFYTADVLNQFQVDHDMTKSTEEKLSEVLARTPNEQITAFALRIALALHLNYIPDETDTDFLALAEKAFIPQTAPVQPAQPAAKKAKPTKAPAKKKAAPKAPAKKKAPAKAAAKKTAAKPAATKPVSAA